MDDLTQTSVDGDGTILVEYTGHMVFSEVRYCSFCGRLNKTVWKCCSDSCAKHLDEFLNTSMTNNFALSVFNANDSYSSKMNRLKDYAKRHKTTLDAAVHHYRLRLKSIGILKEEIKLTYSVVEYFKLGHNIDLLLKV